VLEEKLDGNKTRYAALLGARVASEPALARRMPQHLQDAITSLRGLT
jgi:hypothetical protein